MGKAIYHDAEHQKRAAYMREWNKKHQERVNEQKRNAVRSNPEPNRARVLAWQKSNPDKVNEHSRTYRKNNPEKRKETMRKYRETHKEQIKAYAKISNLRHKHMRRAQLKNVVSTLTAADEREIKKAGCFFADDTCSGTLTIAHDYPISKGGNSTRGNVFCLCNSHNVRMGTKSLQEFIKQLSLL